MRSRLNYSRIDRMFHRVAFSSPAVQLTAADVEQSLYARRFVSITPNRPVFITSLPRAGTTLLFEHLGQLATFATYSYRDMPFVLAPLLWQTLSRASRQPALAEPVGGDGMPLEYDSLEDFEEVLWMSWWPERFDTDWISLWHDDEDAEAFGRALVSEMQRIIVARGHRDGVRRRYLSKNNANIARLGLLKRLVPDAAILVPFRQPMDQAASLLRQHLRFGEIHRADPRARQYMEQLGHFEFGAAHRPIRFEWMEQARRRYRHGTVDYWLAYWIAAYEHVLKYRDRIMLVPYEWLCAAGGAGMRRIASELDVPEDSAASLRNAPRRPPRAHRPDDDLPRDRRLVERADALYQQLSSHSLALS